MYGVPGNHDYWSKAPLTGIAKCLAATGGAWLLDQQQVTADGKFSIIGATCRSYSDLKPGVEQGFGATKQPWFDQCRHPEHLPHALPGLGQAIGRADI